MLATTQPDLAEFTLHKVLYEVDFCGVRVPGACAAFYRRGDGDRTLSVGIYMVDGSEVFRAWGYTDQEHCSFHSVPRIDGEADGPYPGCPEVDLLREGSRVTGITVSTPAARHRFAGDAWQAVG